jgi:hypothetical protein
MNILQEFNSVNETRVSTNLGASTALAAPLNRASSQGLEKLPIDIKKNSLNVPSYAPDVMTQSQSQQGPFASIS